MKIRLRLKNPVCVCVKIGHFDRATHCKWHRNEKGKYRALPPKKKGGGEKGVPFVPPLSIWPCKEQEEAIVLANFFIPCGQT